MFRSIAGLCLLSVLSTLVPNERCSAQPKEEEPSNKAQPFTFSRNAVALASRLATRINLDKPLEDERLEAVLKAFDDRHQLSFWVDTAAIRDDVGGESVEEMKVNLPKVTGGRLDTVLRRLLKQVDVGYVLRDGFIEVTSLQRIYNEFYPDYPDYPINQYPLVHAVFEEQPLYEALRDLAESAGCNVVTDIVSAAKTKVTAQLTNVPLDTAVQMLADMAGLEVAKLDNVLYVTNAASAKRERLRAMRGSAIDHVFSGKTGYGPGNNLPYGLGKNLPADSVLVNVAFEQEPLDQALRHLAKVGKSRVNINTSLPEATKPITADLGQLPLDQAVTVLADMAGLRVVKHDNFLYVTTAKEARRLLKELK